MGQNWTESQKIIIEDAGINQNQIVSASAGSGKTSVMIERIVRTILKGVGNNNPKYGLDKILIVTFTRDSARDMKEKLKEKLISSFKKAGYVEKEYIDLRSIKFQECKFCQIITLDIKALRTCSIKGVKFLDDINKVMSDWFIELQERSWETEMYVEALEGYYFICNQSFDRLEIPKELLQEFEEIKSCMFQGC